MTANIIHYSQQFCYSGTNVYKTYQEKLLGVLSFSLAVPMVKAQTFLQNHKHIQTTKAIKC